MAHDIVIRGGLIVDGSGREGFLGDLAIDNGLISAIGDVPGKGRQEIDAKDHVVSPGFVDLHTHLDAQIGWDPDLTPVSWHGVTTALMGNCGLTFAPCKPADRSLLASMMETVEDIPAHAILSGLPWTWEDYGGYLDALDGIKPGINIGGLIGHSAVRFNVMGDRSFADQATPAEVQEMCDIVATAMDCGALGFSTNRYEPHKAPDGRSIPGTFADPSELIAIAQVVGARGGVMQAVGASPDFLKAISDEGHCRVLFSWGVGDQKGAGANGASYLDSMIGDRDMTAITQVRGTGSMFGLQGQLPFRGETWSKVRRMKLAERFEAINTPETFAKLVEEGASTDKWDGLKDIYYLGVSETPNYTAETGDNVLRMMAGSGETFAEIFLRVAKETQGKGLFNFRMFCKDLVELGDLFKSDHIFPSLGDAGAHVSQIMDADWTTFVLAYWIRDRKLYSLGEGIRRMTSGPARVMGLQDRGVLEVGKRADINVFDLAKVTQLQPEIVHDFPGGAPRFIQRAKGYRATLVNGQVNILNDAHTGTRAGTVIRHAALAMA